MRRRTPATMWPKITGMAPAFVEADELGTQVRACRDMGTEKFFELATVAAQEFAQATCARCPLFDACEEYAMSQPQLKGWWAGTSENTRRAERARRAEQHRIAA